MPWFNQPKPNPTHVLKVPEGTILKSKNGRDLLIREDIELNIIAEFSLSIFNQGDILYADCEVRDPFKAAMIPYEDEQNRS